MSDGNDNVDNKCKRSHSDLKFKPTTTCLKKVLFLLFVTILLLATVMIMFLQQLSFAENSINVNNDFASITRSSNYQNTSVEQQVDSELKSTYDNNLSKYSGFTSTLQDYMNKIVVTTSTDQTTIINNGSLIVTSASNAVKLGSKTAALELHLSNYFIDDLGYYHLTGQVTNLGNTSATYVQITAALCDTNGKVVDKTFVEVHEIDSGKTVPIELVATKRDPIIASVSVNVDSLEYPMTGNHPVSTSAKMVATVTNLLQNNTTAFAIANILSDSGNTTYSIPIQQQQQEQSKSQLQSSSNRTASLQLKTETEATSLSSLMLKATDGYNNAVDTPSIGSLVLLSTNITNNNAVVQPFVIIIEIRDGNGITISLQILKGILNSHGNTEVGVSWIPELKGKYEIRSFAITSMENPDILSAVVRRSVNVS